MGPYCVFCDHRCFVQRVLPFKDEHLIMATCPGGMANDRRVTGYDHTTAVNPSAGPVLEAGPEPFEASLERARSLAATLEGQVARLVEMMGRASAALAEADCAPDCCQEDEPLVFEREACLVCKARALLDTSWLDPTGTDRLIDVLSGAEPLPAVSGGC